MTYGTQRLEATAVLFAILAIAVQAQDTIGPWRKTDLLAATPKHYPSDQFNVPGVKSIMYEGLTYKGKTTRFYGYYRTPEGAAPASGWPAVVLVHGGGGTAGAGWVEEWAKHGYAAISMDLEGHLPKPGVPHNKRPGHPWSGPARAGNFEEGKINKGLPVEEHWFYHAIGGVVRAHSLLRSFPEIDKDRIGIEGDSWGGVLTSVAVGVDSRFKFGITHTGCGFLHEGDSYLGKSFQRRSPEKLKESLALYEASTYLPNVEFPMLWTCSPTDLHFPLDCTQKSALATKGPSHLWVKVGWGHARRPEKEPYVFADSVVRRSQPLPQRGELVQDGKTWSATFTSPFALQKAELCYTTDTGVSHKRKWHAIPARLDAGRASAELPEGTTVFFFNVTDADGRMASSLSRELKNAKPAKPKPRKPNVIVIMADDLGYGDVSCYGATEISTPHIDRLAKEGLRFTSGYCSASTCTPTRFSFLTGKYAFRQKGAGIAPPNATALIQPGTVTLPSILKQAGYATAVIGKWHLGLGKKPAPNWNGELKPGPLEIGFDRCFLLPTTNDRVPCVYVEDHRVRNLDPEDPLWVSHRNIDKQPTGKTHRKTLKMDWHRGHNGTIHNGISRIGFFGGGHKARFRDEDLADAWVTESVKWIKKQQSSPFFLFFSSHDIHVPRMPHERFQGKTSLGYRGDAIVELDWCVGELLETLERLKLTENTLVVFCSDNGPRLNDGYKDGAVEKNGEHKPAGPYKGGKYTVYEGGTRTPFITRWPGTIKPGVSDEMVCTIDLAASLGALVGQDLADSACPDSFDVLPALLGKPSAKGRGHLLQQGNNSSKLALRTGNWKLLRQGKRYELYDLDKDPGEGSNLYKTAVEIAARLKTQMEKLESNGRSRP